MKLLDINIILTLFCWGLWGIVDKKALGEVNEESVVLRLYLIAVLWIPVSFFALNYFEPSWTLNSGIILWTGLTSIAYAIALVAYLAAMKATEASFVLGMTAAYPLVFQFLATMFLKEELVGERLIGALIIGFGLFLISSSANSNKDNGLNEPAESRRNPLLYLCIIVAILSWGTYGLFDKKAVGCGSPLLVFFTKSIWDMIVFLLLLLFYRARKADLDWQNKKAWYYCSFSELALGLGGLTYLAAMSMASASYVITITGCYPLIMYLFAIWLLKEKFNRLRFLGILLVVAGGILVQATAGA